MRWLGYFFIFMGKWADLVILAPATADLIARVAAGMANDLRWNGLQKPLQFRYRKVGGEYQAHSSQNASVDNSN